MLSGLIGLGSRLAVGVMSGVGMKEHCSLPVAGSWCMHAEASMCIRPVSP